MIRPSTGSSSIRSRMFRSVRTSLYMAFRDSTAPFSFSTDSMPWAMEGKM